MTDFEHVSVLADEVVAALAPTSGRTYVDVTVGGAGHAARILEEGGPDAKLIAFDRDPHALEAAHARLQEFGDRVTFVHSAFERIREVLTDLGVDRVAGVLADLGVSSPQLDRAERGFSFRKSGPIDMRMDPTTGETALELIARLDEGELANVIFELGEDRKSRHIAHMIKKFYVDGDLETTEDLRRAVHRAIGPKRGRIDPATRTFQALRIAVNTELEQLDTLLTALPDVLEDDGVGAIISFHSLEDRKVKWSFRRSETMTPLTKRPLVATDEEAQANARSRTAKLRAARRLPREAQS